MEGASLNRVSVCGEEFDNPFDFTMESFLESQELENVGGESIVQFVRKYHTLPFNKTSSFNMAIPDRVLVLDGEFEYCLFIASLNLFFVKFKSGAFSFFSRDEIISNRQILSSIFNALLDSYSSDLGDNAGSGKILNILSQNYLSYVLPMTFSGSIYDMIFFYNDSLLCRKISDKQWVRIKKSEFRSNKVLLESLSRQISLVGQSHNLFVKNHLYKKMHVIVFAMISHMSVMSDLYINKFGQEWFVSVKNGTLHIDGIRDSYGDILYIVVRNSGNIVRGTNPFDLHKNDLVISCRKDQLVSLDSNNIFCVELISQLILEAYRATIVGLLSLPLGGNDNKKYSLSPFVVSNFVINKTLSGDFVDSDSLNCAFRALLSNMQIYNGLISSPLQSMMIDSSVENSDILSGRVIALTDEDKKILSHLGGVLGILIDREFSLSIALSKIMAVGLLAFTICELENSYDDLSYRRRLQICQLLERSIGGNCLSDNLVEFVLGNNVDFGDDFDKVVRQFQYHIAPYKKGVGRTKKDHLLLISCHIIDYINKEYLQYLESIFYLSKGMMLFAKSIDVNSHHNTPLMRWFGKLSGEYSRSIDDLLKNGDFSKMNDEIKSLGTILLYNRYAMLSYSLVYGSREILEALDEGVKTPYYHSLTYKGISWLQEYINNVDEWEQREFLKFVSDGVDYDNWNSLQEKIYVYLFRGVDGPFHQKNNNKYLNVFIPDCHLINSDEQCQKSREAFISSLRKSISLFNGSVDIL